VDVVDHLIVPVDGSEASWHAVEIAVALARRSNSRVDVVEVVFEPREVDPARLRLEGGIARLAMTDVPIEPVVSLATEGVAAAVAELVEANPGAVLTMASHGRGRSAALLGSIAEDLLGRVFGPILVVGPRAVVSDFSGPTIATVDGSELAEAALPLASAWAIELGSTVWVIEVAEPDGQLPADVGGTGYVSRLAANVGRTSAREVQFEVLRGRHPDQAVADFARSIDASLVVASTHGRTGMSRLVVGSTAAGFVRHVSCPVLLVRPPHFTDVGGSAGASAASR
jgi:nucleotide-binding universal stress UspA family protein